MRLSEDLARARADVRELAWVKRRIADANEDRASVASKLIAAERVREYERADVDALTTGVGGVFRRLVANHAALSTEQQDLAAAQLLCDELADELRAIDFELSHLAERAAAVADAEVRYAGLLADVEWKARARGVINDELDTLDATRDELLAACRETAEAVRGAIYVQNELRQIVDLVRELHPYDTAGYEDPILGEGLWNALTGTTSGIYANLRAAIARAQQGLRQFQHACADIISNPGLESLEMQLSLPSVGPLGLLWSTPSSVDDILPEVSRVSSALAFWVGELRAHGAKLDRSLVECATVRTRLLDPPGPDRL